MIEKVLIKNVRIPDPNTQKIENSDILFSLSDKKSGGRIIEISENIFSNEARIIDGEGGYLLPCFCDIAADFCEPGYLHRESIETGSLAAFYGGYSQVMLTPDTEPFADRPEVLDRIGSIAERTAHCEILKCGALTLDGKGKSLCDYELLCRHGALCFSDGNSPQYDMRVLRAAMSACAVKDLTVILTPQKDPLYAEGVMNCSKSADILGVKGEPSSVEARMVAAYLILAKETGCRIHIRNISCAASVCAVKTAKEQGVRVTASVSAHHFSLTDKDTVFIGANAKIYPPLRAESDRQAVIRGIADKTIDCIESGHVPLSLSEKAGGMKSAAFGAIGLQSVFSCVCTYLLSRGHIDIFRAIELLCIEPRRILGLEPLSKVDENCKAFTLCDFGKEMILTNSYLKSRSTNCPYVGMSLCGSVRNTFIL